MSTLKRLINHMRRLEYFVFLLGMTGVTLVWMLPVSFRVVLVYNGGDFEYLAWLVLLASPLALISLVLILCGLLGTLIGGRRLQACFRWVAWWISGEEEFLPAAEVRLTSGAIGQPAGNNEDLRNLYGLLWLIVTIALGFGLLALVVEMYYPRHLQTALSVFVACGAALTSALMITTAGYVMLAQGRANRGGSLFWLFFDEEDHTPKPVDPNSTGGIIGRALDLTGGRIKDAFLDLSGSTAATDQAQSPVVPPLPPMNRDAFVSTLLPRVEVLLNEMADEIDRAPAGQVLNRCQEGVHRAVERLEDEAFKQGLELRIDAGYAALPKDRRPQGDWARRYRLMVSAGDQSRRISAAIQNPKG